MSATLCTIPAELLFELLLECSGGGAAEGPDVPCSDFSSAWRTGEYAPDAAILGLREVRALAITNRSMRHFIEQFRVCDRFWERHVRYDAHSRPFTGTSLSYAAVRKPEKEEEEEEEKEAGPRDPFCSPPSPLDHADLLSPATAAAATGHTHVYLGPLPEVGRRASSPKKQPRRGSSVKRKCGTRERTAKMVSLPAQYAQPRGLLVLLLENHFHDAQAIGERQASPHTDRLSGWRLHEQLLVVKLHHPLPRDLELVRHVHTVHLYYVRVRSLAPLAGVHSLHLQYADALDDVSALSQAYRVHLERCGALRNVDALGSVHTVSLVDNALLEDVSSLHAVHTLRLQSPTGQGGGGDDDQAQQRHHELLGGVHTLRLFVAGELRDNGTGRPRFRGCHQLDLSGSWALRGLACGVLGNVQRVCCDDCAQLSDLRALHRVRRLSALRCHALRSLEGLASARHVRVGGSSLCDLGGAPLLEHLVLSQAPRVRDLAPLAKLHSLLLHQCNLVEELGVLAAVPLLWISRCARVRDVDALSAATRLMLNECPLATGSSQALCAVRRLRIVQCPLLGAPSELHAIFDTAERRARGYTFSTEAFSYRHAEFGIW
mmetsp:Transcript_6094/g.18575  ORF Transcript_6094/g.18575 Transcript_6094/m.18575 type:complete len:603 (-) Transcript_6094:42-1850(-)